MMTGAGVTSTDNGINLLVDLASVTRDRRRVNRVVRANIAQFVEQLEAFAKDSGRLVARSS
jgi:hypothetical protein